MLIYNVTVKVESKISEQWLQWLKKEHIREVLQTKCFSDYRIVRLLEIDDSDGPTFAIQYFTHSKADYNRYIELYESDIQKIALTKWGEQFIAFRSVMEVVQ